MTDNLQFYPTPARLARRAWKKFEKRTFVRVLEPSAGNGDLAKKAPWYEERYARTPIDCCEIDITRHPALKAAGFSVVGVDFLDFRDGAIYDTIILNPPFREGAKHVLKAWEILWDGEIVAILNAETVRNAYSADRQMLVSLIEHHGSIEFLTDTFHDPDTLRKTDVEVALVYLRKQANLQKDIIGSLLDDLAKDPRNAERLSHAFHDAQDLTVPSTAVEQAVIAFDTAVAAAREAVFAQARQQHYAFLLGKTIEQINSDKPDDEPSSQTDFVLRELQKRYDELKNRAWAGILRSSKVMGMLSSEAQRRLESDFDTIKDLEFTATNVFGFLKGIADRQGEIQIGMACDVFDLFTRYHSENTVFYKGWKSNDNHRTCGMRLKTTRFILPHHKTESWNHCLSHDSMQVLRDIDKVFAMLDGKANPAVSLESIFTNQFDTLRSKTRVKASYFDVRYHHGIGTIHFFPTNKELVDRLNRLVGRHRQWLPPEGERVSDAFWLQYEKAEHFDAEVREQLQASGRNRWDNPLWGLHSKDHDNHYEATLTLSKALDAVLAKHGLGDCLTGPGQEQRLPLKLLA